MASRAAVWRKPTNTSGSAHSNGSGEDNTPKDRTCVSFDRRDPTASAPGPRAFGRSRASAAPARVVATAGASRCAPRELTLSHELTVRGSMLAAAPYLSAWFRHPEGDPERWWRLVVRPKDADVGAGAWTLALQLATTEELDSLLHARPRCLAAPAGVVPSESYYLLKTVDAKVVLNRGCVANALKQERFQTHRPASLLNNNFSILGYVRTLEPVSVCDLSTDLLAEARSLSSDDRALCVQVSFTVEFHETDALT